MPMKIPAVLLHPNMAEDANDTLLKRLGGEENLEVTIIEFYDRILKDPALRPFFGGVNMAMLKMHQKRFMMMAFTTIPEDFDLGAYIIERHWRLFEKGLNETHFDLVAGHLVATLKEMWVEHKVIDDVVKLLVPFRSVFDANGRQEKIQAFVNSLRVEREEKKARRKRREERRFAQKEKELRKQRGFFGRLFFRQQRSA